MLLRLVSPFALVAVLATSPAWGAADCDCMHRTPREELSTRALVFLGTVESTQESRIVREGHPNRFRRTQRVVARMQSIWKGTPQRQITISGIGPGVCEGWPQFVVGETYVIYADSTAHGLWVDYCSRTAPSARAAEDLAALGIPTIVQRLPGRKLRPTR